MWENTVKKIHHLHRKESKAGHFASWNFHVHTMISEPTDILQNGKTQNQPLDISGGYYRGDDEACDSQPTAVHVACSFQASVSLEGRFNADIPYDDTAVGFPSVRELGL